MKSLLNKLNVPLCGAAVLALLSGCASSGVKNPSGVPVTHMTADEQGFVAGTGIESQDLVMVTDKMARSILGIPQIANAATPPTIVLDPVDNQTRFPDQQGDLPDADPGAIELEGARQGDVPGAEPDASAGEGAQPEARGQRDREFRPQRAGVQRRGLLPHRHAARAVHAHQGGHQRLHPVCFPAYRRPDAAPSCGRIRRR